jgi:phytoene synthase
VGADARRDRLYLPLEDLARFGLADREVLDAAAKGNAPSPRLQSLLGFQADRAREQYARAEALLPAADRKAMVPARIMSAVYRATLEEVVRRGFPLGAARVGLSRPRKAWIAASTLLRSRRP